MPSLLTLHAMKLAMSPTRENFPLSTKKIVKKTLGSAILFGVLALIGLLLAILGPALISEDKTGAALMTGIGIAMIMVFGGLIVAVYFYQRWYFSTYFYDLTVDNVIIRKGPITPREITIPYERIQDVYVDQDLLDRLMGLYDVHISSATMSSGYAAHIDGVEKAAADGLRAQLLKTVSDKINSHRAAAPAPTPQV